MNLHIIKYAKHHYGHTDNIFEDLAVLIEKYSLWKPTREEDFIQSVQIVWAEYGEQKDRFPGLLIDYLEWNPITEDKPLGYRMVELMLSQLRFISVKGEALAELLPKNHPGVFFGSDDDKERMIKQLPDMIES